MQQTVTPDSPRTYLVGCDGQGRCPGIYGQHKSRACKTGSWPEWSICIPARDRGWRLYARAGWWKLNGGLRGRHGFKFRDGFLDAIGKKGFQPCGIPRLCSSYIESQYDRSVAFGTTHPTRGCYDIAITQDLFVTSSNLTRPSRGLQIQITGFETR
jgi:hypothetical protein